jgi:hypothetical protein
LTDIGQKATAGNLMYVKDEKIIWNELKLKSNFYRKSYFIPGIIPPSITI